MNGKQWNHVFPVSLLNESTQAGENRINKTSAAECYSKWSARGRLWVTFLCPGGVVDSQSLTRSYCRRQCSYVGIGRWMVPCSFVISFLLVNKTTEKMCFIPLCVDKLCSFRLVACQSTWRCCVHNCRHSPICIKPTNSHTRPWISHLKYWYCFQIDDATAVIFHLRLTLILISTWVLTPSPISLHWIGEYRQWWTAPYLFASTL